MKCKKQIERFQNEIERKIKERSVLQNKMEALQMEIDQGLTALDHALEGFKMAIKKEAVEKKVMETEFQDDDEAIADCIRQIIQSDSTPDLS